MIEKLRNACTNDDAKARPWTGIIKMSFLLLRGFGGVESHLPERGFACLTRRPCPRRGRPRYYPVLDERWDDS